MLSWNALMWAEITWPTSTSPHCLTIREFFLIYPVLVNEYLFKLVFSRSTKKETCSSRPNILPDMRYEPFNTHRYHTKKDMFQSLLELNNSAKIGSFVVVIEIRYCSKSRKFSLQLLEISKSSTLPTTPWPNSPTLSPRFPSWRLWTSAIIVSLNFSPDPSHPCLASLSSTCPRTGSSASLRTPSTSWQSLRF